jgi:hypothetical protein
MDPLMTPTNLNTISSDLTILSTSLTIECVAPTTHHLCQYVVTAWDRRLHIV